MRPAPFTLRGLSRAEAALVRRSVKWAIGELRAFGGRQGEAETQLEAEAARFSARILEDRLQCLEEAP